MVPFYICNMVMILYLPFRSCKGAEMWKIVLQDFLHGLQPWCSLCWSNVCPNYFLSDLEFYFKAGLAVILFSFFCRDHIFRLHLSNISQTTCEGEVSSWRSWLLKFFFLNECMILKLCPNLILKNRGMFWSWSHPMFPTAFPKGNQKWVQF